MSNTKYFITGGAGFIGSNLVDRILSQGNDVIVYDNFSTGIPEYLDNAKKSSKFQLIKGDTLNKKSLTEAMIGCDFVFHLAANADVRFGTEHPSKDLEQNTIATFNVLEAMRENSIKNIAFSSTGSIYGESKVIPTPEDAPFPVQTSLYGASKLAGEGLIQAYAEGFGFQAWIFRFVSILGERYPHGHVFDFYKQLRKHPDYLDVLGDGHQKKSYLYVQDCIDAIFTAIEKSNDPVNIFNLGTDEYVEVNNSINWICSHLGLNPEIRYTGGERGWIGDNPFIFLDCKKICSLGWKPKNTIQEGIIKTLDFLKENPWVLERR
ncbi:NAD-dependent epimerase/dehydratase family protein [Methanomicrobium antiquum]|uniref:NAD-dependent epimerase/dehydratase family protein n=1 Tax=Methanomicrobium antiquum TaxID=487686 RepID=A0AAF0FNK5_9EURY|nr:NAD-dependent epimerase/dehydratase family protein [Methanomicrobium antiquum]WFN36795.1 NAD-dependent epimerase/dehydratase family protein [Methanomicrobium antiquum]